MNKKTPSSERRHGRREIGKRSPKSTIRGTKQVEREARQTTIKIGASAREIEAEIVRFRTGDRSIDFNVDVTRDTVWATLQQIADLFGTDQSVVFQHIRNVFDSRELEENQTTHTRVAPVRSEGGCEVTPEISHYSLDVILSVGYRIDTKAATDFRKWANAILRSYVMKGFALNEARLRSDTNAADDLAARLRAIRSEEKHVFAKVRDFFKEASIDYDGSDQACRTFFALLQDKFHYAASGLTACQLVLTRANHKSENMGLTTFDGDTPTIQDVKVGKNYLSESELRILYIVSDQFLSYVQSKAMRDMSVTMKELAKKFDDLLRFNEYEVFAGYGRDLKRPQAERHAIAELARFMVRQRKKTA